MAHADTKAPPVGGRGVQENAERADASRTMPRGLLVLAVLGAFAGAETAQAVARTHGRHAPAKRRKATVRPARAVKLGGVAWVPPATAGASRPPLAGTPTGVGGDTTTTDGAAAPGIPAPATTTTTDGGGAPDPPAQQALGVTVDERTGYTMVLSRTRLSSGSVVVQLINNGADAHNLRIVRTDPSGDPPTDLPEAPKQSQTSKALTLQPGRYYLFCTLTTPKSHEQAGMHATLRVDP